MNLRRTVAPRLLPLCLSAVLLAGCSDSGSDPQGSGAPPEPQLRCAPEPAAAAGAAPLESACAQHAETAA